MNMDRLMSSLASTLRAAQLEREYSEELEKARRQVFETYGIDDAFIRKMDRTISVNKIDKWVEAQRQSRSSTTALAMRSWSQTQHQKRATTLCLRTRTITYRAI